MIAIKFANELFQKYQMIQKLLFKFHSNYVLFPFFLILYLIIIYK